MLPPTFSCGAIVTTISNPAGRRRTRLGGCPADAPCAPASSPESLKPRIPAGAAAGAGGTRDSARLTQHW